MEALSATPAAASSLRFDSFQVQEVHLRTDPAALGAGFNYTANFYPTGRLNWSLGRFELLLRVTLGTDDGLFEADIKTLSRFTFDSSHAVEPLYQLLCHNAPALVFPYVRAYIGALTALSGLPTVLAPVFDLSGLAAPLRAAIKEVEEG